MVDQDEEVHVAARPFIPPGNRSKQHHSPHKRERCERRSDLIKERLPKAPLELEPCLQTGSECVVGFESPKESPTRFPNLYQTLRPKFPEAFEGPQGRSSALQGERFARELPVRKRDERRQDADGGLARKQIVADVIEALDIG